MTTTSTFQGIGEGQRISSRVLKPPGGGSSISFGGDEQVHPSKTTSPTATAPHENNKSNGTVQNGNHINGQSPTTNGTCNGTMSNGSMTPNGSCTTASSPGSAKSIDTQNRLFGGSEHSSARERNDTPTKPSSKPTKLRDHMRSSIFGDDSGTPSRNSTPNGTAYYGTWRRRDPVTGEGVQCWDLHAPRHGSFHRRRGNTGRGTPSGAETSVKETPEPPKPASAPAAQPQQKQRVPPGGFSTALW